SNTSRRVAAFNVSVSSSECTVPSTGGKPSDSGVSRRNTSNPAATTSTIPAGTKKQSRQSIGAKYTQRIKINPAPSECELFQIAIFVANSRGENQCVMSRAHGGKPIPWNQPLIIHSTPSTTSDVLKPKKILTTAQHTRPNGMNHRAFNRSPKKPLAN